jgi:hypothetical protein
LIGHRSVVDKFLETEKFPQFYFTFFSATVQSVKEIYLIEVKNITLPCIEVLGVLAEEYYFALH